MRQLLLSSLVLFFLFHDACAQKNLTYYIYAAQENSPLVHSYRNNNAASKLETERLKSVYTRPQVSLTGNFLFAPIISNDNGEAQVDWNPYIAEDYSGYDLAASNGGAYAALVNINQPLFNGGRYKAFSDQALLDIRSNDNDTQMTFHDLEKAVTDQYIKCVMNYRQLEFTQALLEIIGQQESIILKLLEKSIAKPSDLSLLIIEQKAQEILLNDAQSNYRNSLLNLRILCGLNDTTYQIIEDPGLTLNPEVRISKFTEKYRLDSLHLIANQLIFETRYKPSTTFFANTGLNAVQALSISNRFGLSAGINFSLSITDGKQRHLVNQRTSALMKSVQASKLFFTNQNNVRRNRIKDALKSVAKRLGIMEGQLVEYQKLLKLYSEELSQGQLSFINYLTALKNMTASNRDYVLLLMEKELLISEFNYWNW